MVRPSSRRTIAAWCSSLAAADELHLGAPGAQRVGQLEGEVARRDAHHLRGGRARWDGGERDGDEGREPAEQGGAADAGTGGRHDDGLRHG
jgi:hypothetical protein